MTGETVSETPDCCPAEPALELTKELGSEAQVEEVTLELRETAPGPPATPEPGPQREDLPSTPLLLTVEDVTDSSVTLSWEPPEELGSSGLQGYLLERCGDGATEWVPVSPKPMMVTQHTLRNLSVGDKFLFRVSAVGPAGVGPPATLDQLVHIREIVETPKIWVPRFLRQTYIRQVGEVVNLQIPFQGKPKPQATWTHNGSTLDPKRVSVRSGDRDSILFIRAAERTDSGCYELCVQQDGQEARAAIHILVIEKPGPPQSIKLVDVWGFNASLEWTPPLDTGNTELTGYTVQKSDKKSGQWFTVLEHYHQTSCIVSDLIMGNSYSFRVFSENQCGLSPTAPVTADLAHIQKADTVAKTGGFIQRDFSEAPKFTQPLQDRTTTTGYSTQLFCCVRASPKPKIIWMKNRIDIQGDPKYRALINHGVCSLEIRKPSPFDGGVYTCKAINALGEASVDCRLDVKESRKLREMKSEAQALPPDPHPLQTLSLLARHMGSGRCDSRSSVDALRLPRLHHSLQGDKLLLPFIPKMI
ncbi:myosin-binding protein H [Ornithorhynchus anatinus]|nr:myosin-binding protein H [Ornithorhynchus anatinus]